MNTAEQKIERLSMPTNADFTHDPAYPHWHTQILYGEKS
jgi:hypothetical protein